MMSNAANDLIASGMPIEWYNMDLHSTKFCSKYQISLRLWNTKNSGKHFQYFFPARNYYFGQAEFINL